MPSDIVFPSTLHLDKDSRYSALGAVYGNTFCGLMSCPDGVIFLVPYTNLNPEVCNRPGYSPTDPTREAEYPASHQVRVAGQPYRSIYHQEGGLPGHEQLMIFLTDTCGIRPAQGFLGFSLQFSTVKRGFGGTSRSQNNQHFRNWTGGSQESAFETYRATASDPMQPPRFHDVTVPGSGELPSQWQEQMKSFLMKEIPEFASCIRVKISNAVKESSNVPVAPVFNPKPKRYR